jgi:hypothetical protein
VSDGYASDVGLLTGVLSLARTPVRLTLRTWEFGLSTAAEAARLGLDLLDPGRSESEFSQYRSPSHPAEAGNGGPPEAPEAPVAPVRRPVVADVDEPSAAPADVPPAVPDELIPDHVDEEIVLVAETAEAGAEDGAGPELHIDPPWDGYEKMTAADIRSRLTGASAAEAATVELYEAAHKNRSSVLDAAGRALRR